MTDRYADAVRARRAELRSAADMLTGNHRTELRGELALSRISAVDSAAAGLAQLGREARSHVEDADRATREQLPKPLAAALDAVAAGVHREWCAELRPALRRVATTRSLDVAVDPVWPRLPDPRLPVLGPDAQPELLRPGRSLLLGAAHGLAVWRLAVLPLALLPLFGLPALGGPALAPLAVGLGAAGAVAAVRSQRTTLERATLRRFVDQTIAAGRAAIDADVGRRLLEVERSVGGDLDASVTRRRVAVEAERRLLAADGASGG